MVELDEEIEEEIEEVEEPENVVLYRISPTALCGLQNVLTNEIYYKTAAELEMDKDTHQAIGKYLIDGDVYLKAKETMSSNIEECFDTNIKCAIILCGDPEKLDWVEPTLR